MIRFWEFMAHRCPFHRQPGILDPLYVLVFGEECLNEDSND